MKKQIITFIATMQLIIFMFAHAALAVNGKNKLQSETEISDIQAEPVLVKGEDGRLYRPVSVTVRHVGKPIEVSVGLKGQGFLKHHLNSGQQTIELFTAETEREKEVCVSVRNDGRTVGDQTLTLKPVRKWEIYLVHQTHLDIGYTHPQEEVLKLQVDHLKKALKYIKNTKDYPEEARFKWHPEGMWAVEEFLRTATDQEKKEFIAAAKKGYIHIDALYAQAMTGIYSDEELFELVGCAKRFEKEYGVSVTSAMQTDVPGYTWGLVSALANNGVKYISVGPNWGHRIGHTFDWADNPFYWISPSGKDKVLFWMAGKGYSWFHGKPVGHRIDPKRIFQYLGELDNKGYPYDLIQVRYNIGADNGPPNSALSDFVKEWNEKYAYPKMIIAKNSGVFEKLEQRYADKIPVVSGAFTPYWEDGVASTSSDTAINRRACEKIVQAQTLWSMLDPQSFPCEQFNQAWTKMIMYDEHTWGAWCSVSKPDDPFTIKQADYKQKFALDGARMAEELLAKSLAENYKEKSSAIDVYNTTSWARTEPVILSSDQSTAGDLVKDRWGKSVPSQRLASGELAFVAEKVSPLGSSRYTISAGKSKTAGSVKVDRLQLENETISLAIDSQSGAIKSFRHKAITADLVDTGKGRGLNDFLYILGRDAGKGHSRIQGPVKVTIEDTGPLVGTLKLETDAPGCKSLTRKIRIYDGSDQVELVNILDKTRETRPEGVYFDFPMNIPDGVAKIDIPWAVIQPEKDQIKGANRNYYCVQRWVDISNADYGITWVTVDAPMLQFDPIIIAATTSNKSEWRTKIEPGQTFYSWVMNNHWETNYKAYQEGICTFKYALKPHNSPYNEKTAQQFARNVHQPLIAISADTSKPAVESMLKVENKNVIITSIKPGRDAKALMVRLFNASETDQNIYLQWNHKPKEMWISNPMEDKISKLTTPIQMMKHEIITLQVLLSEK